MQYFIAFLEGIITFISPCLLPMIPIYIAFFANGEYNRKKTFIHSIFFSLGFTIIFVALGAFAGGIGRLFLKHRTAVNIITGFIVVILGLNFTGLVHIGFLNKTTRLQRNFNHSGVLSSFLFGIVFAIGWTPCVGAFLGSALMLASQSGTLIQGILMLISYSLGLAIPFIISALLIDQLKASFEFIKRHYQVINIISGGLLVLVGIMMMTGIMGYLLSLFSLS